MSIESLAARRRFAKKNMLIFDAMIEARRLGDREEFMRLFSTLNISANVALHMKRVYEAERVRESGIRTDRTEPLLGPDWLNE